MQQRLAGARRDPGTAVLEGFHAVKHALRFGAALELLVTPDPAALRDLAGRLAPDVLDAVTTATEIDPRTWARVTRGGLPSPALALAPRPRVDVAALLAGPGSAPVVVLDRPTHLGNVGAAVRVAAAAGAAGVLTTGDADPWHPTALRGGAGLQFAVPTARAPGLPGTPPTDRPVVAVTPGGAPVEPGSLPSGALLVFGTERDGVHPAWRDRAAYRAGIPMRAGVSSLNLATAVAVVLYLGGWEPG